MTSIIKDILEKRKPDDDNIPVKLVANAKRAFIKAYDSALDQSEIDKSAVLK